MIVDCSWCWGTAVDEEGNVCLACQGSTKVSWEFVVQMGAEGRYPLEDRILGAASHPMVNR